MRITRSVGRPLTDWVLQQQVRTSARGAPLMKVFEQFWFLRGVAGAIALAQLVPQFLDLSRSEFLRAAHALLIAWHSVAASVGELIGRIPFLPPLSAFDVNALLFAAAFGLPSSFALVRAGWSAPLFQNSPLFCVGWRAFLIVLGLLLLIASLGAYSLLASPHVHHRIDAMLNPVPGVMTAAPSLRQITNISMLVLLLLSFVVALIVALFTIRGYARGLFVAVTFVLALQVLYLLDAPILSEFINHWSAQAIDGRSYN